MLLKIVLTAGKHIKMADKIKINQKDWEAVAYATGENNLIHYSDFVAQKQGLEKAVCPGIFLFALAEKLAGEYWGGFKEKRIGVDFSKYTYDGDVLIPEINDNEILMKNKGEDVAKFFQKEGRRELDFSPDIETSFEISAEQVDDFYKGIHGKKDGPYFAFAVGAIVNAFLREGQGSVLRNMDLNLYRLPEVGKLETGLKVESKLRNLRGKDITFYTIKAICEQDGKRVLTGGGKSVKLDD